MTLSQYFGKTVKVKNFCQIKCETDNHKRLEELVKI